MLLFSPEGLRSLSVTETTISLAWEPVDLAEKYRLYWGVTEDDQDNVVETVETSLVLTGLEDGVTHYFRVSAVNFMGESPQSGLESAKTIYIPFPAPRGLVADDLSGNAVRLSWQAVPGAGSYRVRYGPTTLGEDFWVLSDLETTADTSIVLYDFSLGQYYRFAVRVDTNESSDEWGSIEALVH